MNERFFMFMIFIVLYQKIKILVTMWISYYELQVNAVKKEINIKIIVKFVERGDKALLQCEKIKHQNAKIMIIGKNP